MTCKSLTHRSPRPKIAHTHLAPRANLARPPFHGTAPMGTLVAFFCRPATRIPRKRQPCIAALVVLPYLPTCTYTYIHTCTYTLHTHYIPIHPPCNTLTFVPMPFSCTTPWENAHSNAFLPWIARHHSFLALLFFFSFQACTH